MSEARLTPFEKALETEFSQKGYVLRAPIYRQDFTAGVEADAVLKKGSEREGEFLWKRFALPFASPALRFFDGMEETSDISLGQSGFYVAKRRIARKNDVQIRLDVHLDSNLYNPRWSPKKVEQVIRSALPSGTAIETVELLSYDHCDAVWKTEAFNVASNFSFKEAIDEQIEPEALAKDMLSLAQMIEMARERKDGHF